MPTPPSPTTDDLSHEPVDGRVRLDTDKLKLLRRQRGLSQSLVADRARAQGRPISIASIKRAELGAPVLYRTALQLAELFEVDVAQLVVQGTLPAALLGEDEGEFAMVGRTAERRLFHSMLEGVRQEGAGRFVYVRGPAGMGKTRLLKEWRRQAEQAQLQVVSCGINPSETSSGLLPLAKMMREFFGLPTAATDKHAVADQLQRRLRSLGLSDALAIMLPPMMELPLATAQLPIYEAMSHETRLQQRAQALREAIRLACQVRPLMVMIEDVHWADENLLDAVSPMIFQTSEDPVVWVLTSRVEKDPLEQRIRPYLPDLPVSVVDLAPLSQDDARALARQAPKVDPARLDECIAMARGNPLFLTQLLLHPDRQSLPDSLHALVRSKMQQLPAQDQDAVRIAAAAGPEFPLRMLRSLMDTPDYLPAEPLAQHLFRACGTGSYAFVHELIRQGIVRDTPDPMRQTLFERLARYHQVENPRLNALYLHQARSPQAPSALMAAMAHACDLYRYEEGLELARQYEAIDYAPQDIYRLRLLQGRIAMGMGRTQDAHGHLALALVHAPDAAARLPVVVLLARTLNLLDNLQAEESLLTEYIPLAQQLGDARHLGQLYYLKGNLHFPRGQHKEAHKLHSAARQQAQLAKDPRTEAQALSGLGDSYYAQGRMLTATEIFQQCLRLCAKHGLADVEASNRFMLATTRLYLNETLGALGDALASAEIASRVGNRRAEIVSRLTAGWLYLSLNKSHQAQQQFDQGLKTAHALGAARFEPFLLEGVARCQWLSGDASAGLDTIRQAWAMVERQGLHRFIGPWVLGTLALLERDEHRRQSAITQGLEILERGCVAHNVYRFCVAAAEAQIQSRQPQGATVLADRLEQFTASEPCPWADHHIRLIRAHVAQLLQPFSGDRQAIDGLIANGLLTGIGHASPLLHEVLTLRD